MRGCKPLTNTEVKAVEANLDRLRDKLLFVLGTKSGFRISELLSLKVGDLITQKGKLADRVNVARKNTKGKHEGRSVVFHPDVAAPLKAYMKALGPTPASTYLFKSRKGDNAPISRIQAYRILKDAMNEAGITGKTGTHSMRKTFAKRVYLATGKELLKTKAALGHKDINSTTAYLSFETDDVDNAILSI